MSKLSVGETNQIEMSLRSRIGSGAGTSLLIRLLLMLNDLLEEAKPPVVSDEEAAKIKADEDAAALALAEEQAVLAQQIADKEASDKAAAEKEAADLAELAKQQAAIAEAEQKRIQEEATLAAATPPTPAVKEGEPVTSITVDEPHPVLEPEPTFNMPPVDEAAPVVEAPASLFDTPTAP